VSQKQQKHVTIMFLRREGELLLAMKKRGFGQGKWNGAGGKVEQGEAPLQAAVRETQEEIGVTPKNARKVAEIDFYMSHDPSFNHFAHIFVATEWEGDIHETEEMRPEWFLLDNIPYERMWGDDIAWLPDVLEGKRFKATYTLDEHDNIDSSITTFLKDEEDFSK
jgi:mutator protein MutT